MSTYAYISNAHPAYIENLYADYKNDKQSVDTGWQHFFEGFEFALQNESNTGLSNGRATTIKSKEGTSLSPGSLTDELKVYALINGYRQKAHLIAYTNPIRPRRDRGAHLELKDFGLSEADLSKTFAVGQELGLGKTTLARIVKRLKDIYARSLGLEYTYMTNLEAQEWLRKRFESIDPDNYITDLATKKQILHKLNQSVIFEQFLGKKYVAQKRFSLEGGESAIPALDAIINEACQKNVKEVIIGMAHRGRLNVLVSILGKTYEQIFGEFEGQGLPELPMGDGDVKYHLGFASQIETTCGDKIQLNLVPNPSHLEAVNPVVLGFARAQADIDNDLDKENILPILIHGDAAVAGQGVVYEVVQMSKLAGYQTGGTIHFIINNQIGFTTDFDDARSADYCTSVAGMVKAPVIHVNGDDVEAVVLAAQIAVDYRQKFQSDIWVDMVCYRKHGHNEGDAPEFTQPLLYRLIKKHKDPRQIYSQKLAESGEVTAEIALQMKKEFDQMLQDRLNNVRENPLPYIPPKPEVEWAKLRKSNPEDFKISPVTGISKKMVNIIGEGLGKIPEGFQPIRKAYKMMQKRRESLIESKTLDWAAAELMAYGSVLLDGYNVRMSGEDVKRGTFSHRHAVLFSEKDESEYNRLNHLSEDQKGEFLIYNSLLSEFAVLGFEFGYALSSPDNLTIWEAQFGDFANGAQTIIDQFISASESKWDLMTGIILLLPHGYEGMGPEHSSARLERFLQLCSEYNIIVTNITDPANFFHAIRRQMNWPFRKPMINMSPKSLLRHPKCISSIYDIMNDTRFEEILDDKTVKSPKKVKKVLMCSGKVFYDLMEYKEANNRTDVAIIRFEQLYPIAEDKLKDILKQYPKNVQLVWVQEEPANMGGLWHILYRLRDYKIDFVARKDSASPATGYKKFHIKEQKEIIERVFNS